MSDVGAIVKPTFDAMKLKAEFPILARTVHGNVPLVYLDNAATSQKPRAVGRFPPRARVV